MKTSAFFLVCFFLFTLLIFQSCSLISKNGECDGNEMKTTEEPVIYLKINFENLPAADSNHDPRSDKAEDVTLKGSIQKIYCDGKASTKFTYSMGFIIEGVDPDHTGKIMDWSEPYQFKFSNNNDLVRVLVDLVFAFNDGTHWETMETFAVDFRFKDLKFDVNSNQYYIEAEFGSDNKLIKVN